MLSERATLPRQLFLDSAAIGVFVPLLARLPGVPLRGFDWFTDYFPGLGGTVLFTSVFNLIPAMALYGVGKASRRAPLAFWFALAALVGFLLWSHGTMNLRSSSTAALGLMFIPLYAVGAVLGGWALGWLVHALTRDNRSRVWLAAIAIAVAVVVGIGTSVNEAIYAAARESRFPVVSVKSIPLTKRAVFACCSIGRVETLAYDEFDKASGKDLAALGATGLAVLDPSTYAVKSQAPFEPQDCDTCVHMYPYVVPDGKGGALVATSDGLSDGRGRLLWQTKAKGFSKNVPIQAPPSATTFLAYYQPDRIDLRDIDGKVRWSTKLPVETVEVYVDSDGRQIPSAITGHGGERRLRLFDAAGNETRAIPLPEWASNVQAIAWPKPGHLLVGAGNWVGVLDPDGREVLRHVIQDTSFNPYHGPDGTAVRFHANERPYLAVVSHGSSGYPRSALLVFDPDGHLVWQEEMNKLRSILAIPNAAGDGEVLLVGGMDGIVEYRLGDASPPAATR